MDISVKYSKRRTKSIKVDSKTAQVTVCVPLGTSKTEVNAFLEKYKSWIVKTVAKTEQNLKNSAHIEVADNGSILYLGRQIALNFVPNLKRCKLAGENLLVPSEKPTCSIINFYRAELAGIVADYIQRYSLVMGVAPTCVKVTSAQTRWGSCSQSKHIAFTFRLVMAPPEVIEYVVVHEMSHLIHMNHSKDFYATVARFYPNYKNAEKWLKANTPLLGKLN